MFVLISLKAIVLSVAGSLGAGLARSLNELTTFRALQGLRGAGVYAIPLTALPEITLLGTFGLMSAVLGILLTSAAVLYVTISSSMTRLIQKM